MWTFSKKKKECFVAETYKMAPLNEWKFYNKL